MEITVNSERIDYTLDDEESLGDVVNGIENWLNQSKLVITSLKLGDRDITAEPEVSWSEIPLSEVPALDVTARLLNEVQVSQLQLMHDYLGRLGDGIASGTAQVLNLCSSSNVEEPGVWQYVVEMGAPQPDDSGPGTVTTEDYSRGGPPPSRPRPQPGD